MQFNLFAPEFYPPSHGVWHVTIDCSWTQIWRKNRKHIEFNITHYVCRTYLARQTIWLRSSKGIKSDFTSSYIRNIINEFQRSADTGSTKWRSPNRKQLYLTLYNRWTRGSNGYIQVFRVARLNWFIADGLTRLEIHENPTWPTKLDGIISSSA